MKNRGTESESGKGQGRASQTCSGLTKCTEAQESFEKRAKALTDEDLLQVLMLRKSAHHASDQEETTGEAPSFASGLTLAERPT